MAARSITSLTFGGDGGRILLIVWCLKSLSRSTVSSPTSSWNSEPGRKAEMIGEKRRNSSSKVGKVGQGGQGDIIQHHFPKLAVTRKKTSNQAQERRLTAFVF